MGLDPGGLTDDDLIGLMLQEPRLIRRPLVRLGGELIVGANEKSLTAALEG
jgi:arsenate reductase-like glutaredoxin family protein